MNKYIVNVLEIHSIQIEVNAIDKRGAIEEAMGGNGRWIDNSMEFIDSVDSNDWSVELLEENIQ